jgi:uncharacterized membrane protein YfcA
VSGWAIVAAFLIMAAGGCLQGAVGFGSNLIAAPLLLLVDESFVPVSVVVGSLVLNALMIRREPGGSFDPTVKVAMVSQVPGALVAGLVISSLPQRQLSLLFAALVLVAVVISVAGWHLRPTRRTLAGAGVAAGFMGTISGIGGPPIALVYQRAPGPTLRATLCRFFLVGGLVSLTVLALSGEVDRDSLRACLVTVPASAAGFAASTPLVRHIDRGSVRPYVLTLSALAAAAVLVRELL